MHSPFPRNRQTSSSRTGRTSGLPRSSYEQLRKFWEKYPDAERPVNHWYRVASKATWQFIAEVRILFPHADAVYDCTVFNIGGNKYRLIVAIRYDKQVIYVKHVLTHKGYDKGGWKKDCGD